MSELCCYRNEKQKEKLKVVGKVCEEWECVLFYEKEWLWERR